MLAVCKQSACNAITRLDHSGIDDADYLITAPAEVVQADQVSRNGGHFPMFATLAPPYRRLKHVEPAISALPDPPKLTAAGWCRGAADLTPGCGGPAAR